MSDGEPTPFPGGEHAEKNRELLVNVARQAAVRLPELPPLERAHLLEGMALLLPEAEAEQCRIAAAAIRHAEEAQLILSDLLKTL